MNFDEFRTKFELETKNLLTSDLVIYNYYPYCFGSGFIVYRIKGFNFKFTFDGRDSSLILERSEYHEKYPKCGWTHVFEQEGLPLNFNEILEIIYQSSKIH